MERMIEHGEAIRIVLYLIGIALLRFAAIRRDAMRWAR